jgi:bloom syndrome protein
MSKKDCENMAQSLTKAGLKAHHYHAGMSAHERRVVQYCWSAGTLQIVCATIAYGMGIDKANVRYVIHASLAKSTEGYFQEAGRAGRDGLDSECVLFYRKQDVSRLTRILSMGKRQKGGRGKIRVQVERLQGMQAYCELTEGCRRRHLLAAFGERCTSCSGCDLCPKRVV